MRVESKFWPSVSRIDDIYGDQNLICKLVTPPQSADVTSASPEPGATAQLRQVSA